MLVLKTLIDKYKDSNQKLYFGFVDFQKAYDTVWREGLLYKLQMNGIKGNFYNIMKKMYAVSECCVKIDDKLTEGFLNNIGVKQGEVMSPLLFNIYINDILKSISDEDSASLNNSNLKCLLYADDLVLISTSLDGLQRKFDTLSDYCDKWRLRVNVNKTMVMPITKSGRPLAGRQNIKYKGHDLEYTNTYKYLGIVFDSSGNFTQAKLNMNERGNKALFKLKSVIDRDFLSPKISLDLFDKTVKPVCLYGSEIWGSVTMKNNSAYDFVKSSCTKLPIEKINIAFCKWLLGVNKYASVFGALGELGRYPLILDVLKGTIRYWLKLQEKRKTKSLINDCLCEAELIDINNGHSWITWNVHDRRSSKKGKVPFIEHNGGEIADSAFCIKYINKTFNVDLNKHLTDEQRAVAHAWRKTLEENTYWTLALDRWDYNSAKKVLNYMGAPWFIQFLARRTVTKCAYAHGIGRHSQEDVYGIMKEDLTNLSNFLGKKKFLLGDQPCEDDCAVFGILSQPRWHAFGNQMEKIIEELKVKETTETNNSASYLDIMLSYDTDGHMNTSLYDKRDDFNFSITNFPFLSSNIPSSPAYGVFISQLIYAIYAMPEQVPNIRILF
ncbi:hypothetical protein FSP39_002749 [Pinctada imbricata]|uniref:Reverse transcriptase domain-containing protein n=1 Tax=Pinctada imbricata TaxID=66713 RepID=A0AA88XKT9_PINIB|nr:hypothetical protein FSP39_002749 [Pinctada imbricata]